MYPLLFQPNLHPIVWGGHRLTAWKCLAETEYNTLSDTPVGESWEVSGLPSSISVIANGKWKGQRLDDIIYSFPNEILGESVVKRYGKTLPLLVKFIDAEQDLSVQVHPDDRMAKAEHNKNGKSEMWYIIDAKPGACIYAGFKEKLTAEEYQKKVAEGTICDALAKHEVKSGDVFYLPAGRVHAICGGILLAEVQQSSDITYRIYDYNRKDIDGKQRELHTELAAKALNYDVLSEYKTIYAEESQRANPCINSPYFNVRIVEIDKAFHRNLMKYGSFIISMCLKGDCLIKIRSTQQGIILREGHSCLIPAAIADYDVIPVNENTRLLDTFIDNREHSLLSAASRFLHISNK